MNFLGIGPMELLVVVVIAYFLLGPKKMASSWKSMGKVLRELREQRDEFTSLLMGSTDLTDRDERRPPNQPKPAPPPPPPEGAISRDGEDAAAAVPVDGPTSGNDEPATGDSPHGKDGQ
jgi:Sec-independent protein translocase protein TatA